MWKKESPDNIPKSEHRRLKKEAMVLIRMGFQPEELTVLRVEGEQRIQDEWSVVPIKVLLNWP